LDINCHVSGKFGDLLPSEDDNRRWKYARFYGTAIVAVDYNSYRILFDNN
jgi:hypothetical protein